MKRRQLWDVIVIGRGIAGLSAAIYLARAKRKVLVIDAGDSLAKWEPDVQNYLGFPDGISGEELLKRGQQQARFYGARFATAEVVKLRRNKNHFAVTTKQRSYAALKILLATGLFHLPPDIPGVKECLGHSMFFCKDCDGVRCEGKRIGIFGWNEEAVDYALAMQLYSQNISIFLNGRRRTWSRKHAQWLKDYKIPIYPETVADVHHEKCHVKWIELNNKERVKLDALFTTRGDVYFNELAKQLRAKINKNGEIVVSKCMETNVPGLFAAGCVTPANCQMIIAAGQGATAAQAINRCLFEESIAANSLKKCAQEKAVLRRK